MAFSKQFERSLDILFKQRTHWLRSKVGLSRPGPPPKFSRKKVDAGIEKLQQIVSDAYSRKLAKSEFEKHTKGRNSWKIKGHGRGGKRKRFDQWYSQVVNSKKGCVYAIWGNRRSCIYVGRTGSGGNRPSSHFEKFWFAHAKRITIYTVKSKSHIPKLECLAIHRFQPGYNKNKASSRRWTKACPLCDIHHSIEGELRQIFRFK